MDACCHLTLGRALAKRGNMLSETFATDTYFPNGKSASCVAKVGNIGETCPQQMFLSTCFLVFFFLMKLANSPGWGHCELTNTLPPGSYKSQQII